MGIPTHVNESAPPHTHTNIWCLYVWIYIYIYIHMDVCVYACMHVCKYCLQYNHEKSQSFLFKHSCWSCWPHWPQCFQMLDSPHLLASLTICSSCLATITRAMSHEAQPHFLVLSHRYPQYGSTQYICFNYSHSLTWIKAIWGWFHLPIMIPGLGRSEVLIICPIEASTHDSHQWHTYIYI